MHRFFPVCVAVLALPGPAAADASPEVGKPLFTRHVEAIFSRLGCNGGTCHGAVKGKNGFRLSLFAADPALDYRRLLQEAGGRRLDRLDPDSSLLLRKATAAAPHGGGRRMTVDSPEYRLLRQWITAGAPLDSTERSQLVRLDVTPSRTTVSPGETIRLHAVANFRDGSSEDVTSLCSYSAQDTAVAGINPDGTVHTHQPGDCALMVRYRGSPALAVVEVARPVSEAFPPVIAHSFVDRHILDKLRRRQVPPAELADDATFLRRLCLDGAGELPSSAEVRAFLADTSADKRERKIEEVLHRPGHAALWTLKLCDLLRASDFGVYADGLRQEVDAPRFQQWIRARLEENLPYDELVERILTATSRDGKTMEAWASDVVAQEEGYAPGRKDLELYRQRRTLDLYWQRSSSSGVDVTLQIAHAFLGLRLECARCHRHPHDSWQQEDLLAFASFFMPVRKTGFEGENEKRYPDAAVVFKRLEKEAKGLEEQVKKLREGELRALEGKAQAARGRLDQLRQQRAHQQQELQRATEEARARRAAADRDAAHADQLRNEAAALDAKGKQAAEQIRSLRDSEQPHEATLAELDKMRQKLNQMERRKNVLSESARRILHSEVRLLSPAPLASVSSPLGTQQTSHRRLLGQAEEISVPPGTDPRSLVMAWLRRPNNPYFARAIVNRVWAHYFGRGIIDPPDNLSSFNPPSHPELLDELCRGFLDHHYDLRWLHRVILNSRTYQQDSRNPRATEADRKSFAMFAVRRLPAEVLLDALDQATGTSENLEMDFFHWPRRMRAAELPFTPQNAFLKFMLSSFGKPKRNAAVQCDCERDGNASVLQVLSLANHPRVWAKITDSQGQISRVLREISADRDRIEELFLVSLSRIPTEGERQACLSYLRQASSPAHGLQGILWSLINTREFILQH